MYVEAPLAPFQERLTLVPEADAFAVRPVGAAGPVGGGSGSAAFRLPMWPFKAPMY